MRGTIRVLQAVLTAAAVAFCSLSYVHATDTYSGVRLWCSGPFTVYSGINADNTSERIVTIIGATKSMAFTYPAGSAPPSLQYFSDRVEVAVPAGKKLVPVRPHVGFIMFCTNNGPNIWCYCTVSDPDNVCDQGGILTGTPDHVWYDM